MTCPYVLGCVTCCAIGADVSHGLSLLLRDQLSDVVPPTKEDGSGIQRRLGQRQSIYMIDVFEYISSCNLRTFSDGDGIAFFLF